MCNVNSQFLLAVALHYLVYNMEIVHNIFLLQTAPENLFIAPAFSDIGVQLSVRSSVNNLMSSKILKLLSLYL